MHGDTVKKENTDKVFNPAQCILCRIQRCCIWACLSSLGTLGRCVLCDRVIIQGVCQEGEFPSFFFQKGY